MGGDEENNAAVAMRRSSNVHNTAAPADSLAGFAWEATLQRPHRPPGESTKGTTASGRPMMHAQIPRTGSDMSLTIQQSDALHGQRSRHAGDVRQPLDPNPSRTARQTMELNEALSDRLRQLSARCYRAGVSGGAQTSRTTPMASPFVSEGRVMKPHTVRFRPTPPPPNGNAWGANNAGTASTDTEPTEPPGREQVSRAPPMSLREARAMQALVDGVRGYNPQREDVSGVPEAARYIDWDDEAARIVRAQAGGGSMADGATAQAHGARRRETAAWMTGQLPATLQLQSPQGRPPQPSVAARSVAGASSGTASSGLATDAPPRATTATGAASTAGIARGGPAATEGVSPNTAAARRRKGGAPPRTIDPGGNHGPAQLPDLVGPRLTIRRAIDATLEALRTVPKLRAAFGAHCRAMQLAHVVPPPQTVACDADRRHTTSPDARNADARARRHDLREQQVMNDPATVCVPLGRFLGHDTLELRRWSVMVGLSNSLQAIGTVVARNRLNEMSAALGPLRGRRRPFTDEQIREFFPVGESWPLVIKRWRAVMLLERNFFLLSIQRRVRHKRAAVRLVKQFLVTRRYVAEIKSNLKWYLGQVAACQRIGRSYLERRRRRMQGWANVWTRLERALLTEAETFVNDAELRDAMVPRGAMFAALARLHASITHTYLGACREYLLLLHSRVRELRLHVGKRAVGGGSGSGSGGAEPPSLIPATANGEGATAKKGAPATPASASASSAAALAAAAQPLLPPPTLRAVTEQDIATLVARERERLGTPAMIAAAAVAVAASEAAAAAATAVVSSAEGPGQRASASRSGSLRDGQASPRRRTTTLQTNAPAVAASRRSIDKDLLGATVRRSRNPSQIGVTPVDAPGPAVTPRRSGPQTLGV